MIAGGNSTDYNKRKIHTTDESMHDLFISVKIFQTLYKLKMRYSKRKIRMYL